MTTFLKRFNEKLIPSKVKTCLNHVVGELEHLKNVKTIAYLNSMLVKGRDKSNYRHLNLHLLPQYNSTDILLKSIFRSYADVVIVPDSYVLKHNSNLGLSNHLMINFNENPV